MIHGCRFFTPMLREQGRGHILNVASSAGLLCSPLLTPYNVTKAGVIALSESLYSELRPAGIGVSVLCPMFFPTNISKTSRGADEKLVDGVIVNGSARMVDLFAGLLRKTQTGYLYHYAFAMILGLIALLAASIRFWQ